MTKPIFDNEELRALVPQASSPRLLEDKLEGSKRGEGFLEAFKRIKEDYQTHDTLLKAFCEAEGFVLKFDYGSYLSDRQPSDEEPPYLSRDFNLPQHLDLLLVAQRSRENYVVLGNMPMSSKVRNGDSVETVISVAVPDQNVQKILYNVGAEELLEPENFALALLFGKATVDISCPEDYTPDKSRDWGFSPKGYHSRATFRTRMEGEDVVSFYREAVKDAAVWQQKLNQYDGHNWGTGSFGNLVANSQNVQLFNRNHWHNKKIPTKIYGFELKPLHL